LDASLRWHDEEEGWAIVNKELKNRVKNAKVENGAYLATTISVVSCDCDPHSVWIRLHAADGVVFAAACLPKEAGEVLATRVAICAKYPGMDFLDNDDGHAPGHC
jgi:hypothetical protein